MSDDGDERLKPRAWNSFLGGDDSPKGLPVGNSEELTRVLNLPRRTPVTEDSPTATALVELMMERLSLGPRQCDCRTIDDARFEGGKHGCLDKLLWIQAWALYEAGVANGLMGHIAAGAGKTVLFALAPLVMRDCKLALLLVPPSLLDQIQIDWQLLNQHFRVPTMTVHVGVRQSITYDARRRADGTDEPVLHVMSFNRISSMESSDYIDKLQPDLVISDECFPADARVMTDEGLVAIGDIVNGGRARFALCHDHHTNTDVWRPITCRMRKPRRQHLVRVTHEHGTFVCTLEHRVWTSNRGYVEASALQATDTLVVRVLRNTVPTLELGAAVLFRVVQPNEHFTNTKDETPRTFSESEEPHARSNMPGVSDTVHGDPTRAIDSKVLHTKLRNRLCASRSSATEGCRTATYEPIRLQQERRNPRRGTRQDSWSHVLGARRERTDHGSTGNSVGCPRTSDGVLDNDSGCSESVSELAASVQSGPGGTRCTPRGRGRWELPQFEEMAVPRSSQDSGAERSRVVGVEVLEQRSTDGPFAGVRTDYVYDLTVDEHHNYFVEGVLVSNCDAFKGSDSSSRALRLLRFFSENPSCRFVGATGSLMNAAPSEFGHLAYLALRDLSPLPRDRETVDDWSRHLGASKYRCPPGALKRLLNPGEPEEDVRKAFGRRLAETLGFIVVAGRQVITTSEGHEVGLVVRDRPIASIPKIVEEALALVRKNIRPDTFAGSDQDEIIVDPMEQARCAREVSTGMFYHWVFPRGEPRWLRQEWYEARKLWNSEQRSMFLRGIKFLDSPTLCENAAKRFHKDLPPAHFKSCRDEKCPGCMPMWESEHWPRWRDIMDQVVPETEAVRLHPFLVEDAAQWASTNPGIVWYGMTEFAEWLSEISDLPIYAGGKEAGARLVREERGDRSVIASMKAHGRGRDRLQYSFHRQLFVNTPASARNYAQYLARLHRRNQKELEVITDVYIHTKELRDALRQAMLCGEAVEETLQEEQKLLLAWRGSVDLLDDGDGGDGER